jgi:hypothetical protein
MATTTNYAWETPDDTDLVKDGAAAIRTLGSSIDTTTKALNPSTTLGDIEYRSSTANTNTRLGIGTTGQVLTVAGGVPSWATPAGGGGKVLQVVNATVSAQVVVSSGTFTDTNLTASITPTSSTSRILVLVSQSLWADLYDNDIIFNCRLMRGATAILTNNNAQKVKATRVSGQALEFAAVYAPSFVDSPATTSSTTYKVQISRTGSADLYAQPFSSSPSSITLLEIGA